MLKNTDWWKTVAAFISFFWKMNQKKRSGWTMRSGLFRMYLTRTKFGRAFGNTQVQFSYCTKMY